MNYINSYVLSNYLCLHEYILLHKITKFFYNLRLTIYAPWIKHSLQVLLVTCSSICLYMHVYTPTYIHTHMHIYIYTYIRTYTLHNYIFEQLLIIQFPFLGFASLFELGTR